jgi:hypothetical protein
MEKQRAPVDVTVSGHSLGGALSPTLALWLTDTRQDWDPRSLANISVYAYAGPSPGNAEFARYVHKRLGKRLNRIFNPLDVVTHAWKVSDPAEIKALYTPDIARDAMWDKAVDFLIATTNGIPYRQIDTDAIALAGEIKQELVFPLFLPMVNLVGQVLYQHTLAYFELLGVAYPEKPSALGRQLAHQSDDIASEILKRAGVWGPFAKLMGAGLRTAAEVYSLVPLLPSPVPETGTANTRKA